MAASNVDQSASAPVLCSVDQGVATVTLNRPERNNGWSAEIETAYFQILADCDANPDVRVIVVTGAGKSFCPGADMNLLTGMSTGSEAAPGAGGAGAPRRPSHFPLSIRKPILGAINGACAGVGLVQALMFDLRFAAAGAKFTVAFSRRGLIAEYGSAWLLPRIVGQSKAMDLLLSSRTIVAEEACSMGLVDRVLPKEQVLDQTLAYAYDVAANCSPASMAVMKRQVLEASHLTIDEAAAVANREMIASFGRPDFSEGVSSFVERRQPGFPPLT